MKRAADEAMDIRGAPALPDPGPVVGLRGNLGRFSLLVLVNAFVGGMVGLERAVLPLTAEHKFGLASKSVILSFIVGFGFLKAFTNPAAGRFSDRIGRKRMIADLAFASGTIVALRMSETLKRG